MVSLLKTAKEEGAGRFLGLKSSRQWREQKQGSWEGKDLSLIEK